MIAALFVDPEGPYVGQPGIDAWTEERDARKYAGPFPVVDHSPCDAWGFGARQAGKVGQDGGCFASGLEALRRWGGVKEHPAGSEAFKHYGLPIPEATRERSRGWTVADEWGGRSCHIDQGAYGHKAQKPTWLYAILPFYPKLRWQRTWDRPYRIGGDGFHSSLERARAKATGKWKPWPQVPEEERHLTPPELRDALVAMARSCIGWQPRRLQVQQPLVKVGGRTE